jgi:hypothetical protein
MSPAAHRLVVGVAVFAMFLPVVIVPYGFSDDYTFLWMAVSGEPTNQFGASIIANSSAGGRPFAGLLISAAFSAAGSIEHLRFVRLLAVGEIAAVALLLHTVLVRSRITSGTAALIAILVAGLPPFQVYASWTVLFHAPLAALLAGAASTLATRAVEGTGRTNRDLLLGAGALFVSALLIYHPAAMFFWVFMAVALVGARTDDRLAVRLARVHFGIAAAALSLAYLVLKLGVHRVGSETRSGARSTLTDDPAGKVRWFFEEPLYRSLNLFDLTVTHLGAALVASIATAGLLLWIVTRTPRPVLYGALALVLVPLTYLPNLVVQDLYPPYRTQVSLAALIALYACLGAVSLWLVLRDSLRARLSAEILATVQRLAFVLAVGVVVAGAFIAAKNVTTLTVEPQMTELRLFRAQVARHADARLISIALTDRNQGLEKLQAFDEFGLPSSSRPWVVRPWLDLILRERGRPGVSVSNPAAASYGPYDRIPANVPLLDLRSDLRRLRDADLRNP